jgi:hypothetical protein
MNEKIENSSNSEAAKNLAEQWEINPDLMPNPKAEDLKPHNESSAIEATTKTDEINLEKTKTEWNMLSELFQREIKTSPEVRAALAEYASTPLTESLFANLSAELSTKNEKINRFYTSQFAQDLRKTGDIENIITDTTRDTKKLMLSHEDRMTALERWRMGRDVKVLALMADLAQTPIEMTEQNGIMQGKTEHGVEIMTEKGQEGLLDPNKWQSRKQIKDRVYEIKVDDKKYIQKERKTNQHRDTLGGGNTKPMTSEEEFLLGRQLAKTGKIDRKDFSIHFEKPLGVASFPDGYDFTIFEFDETITQDESPETPKRDLAQQIRQGEDADYEALKSSLSQDQLHAWNFANQKMDALIDAALHEKELVEGKLGVFNRDANKNWKITKNPNGKKFDLTVYDFEFYAPSNHKPVIYKQYNIDGKEDLRTQLLERYGYNLSEPENKPPDYSPHSNQSGIVLDKKQKFFGSIKDILQKINKN